MEQAEGRRATRTGRVVDYRGLQNPRFRPHSRQEHQEPPNVPDAGPSGADAEQDDDDDLGALPNEPAASSSAQSSPQGSFGEEEAHAEVEALAARRGGGRRGHATRGRQRGRGNGRGEGSSRRRGVPDQRHGGADHAEHVQEQPRPEDAEEARQGGEPAGGPARKRRRRHTFSDAHYEALLTAATEIRPFGLNVPRGRATAVFTEVAQRANTLLQLPPNAEPPFYHINAARTLKTLLDNIERHESLKRMQSGSWNWESNAQQMAYEVLQLKIDMEDHEARVGEERRRRVAAQDAQRLNLVNRALGVAPRPAHRTPTPPRPAVRELPPLNVPEWVVADDTPAGLPFELGGMTEDEIAFLEAQAADAAERDHPELLEGNDPDEGTPRTAPRVAPVPRSIESRVRRKPTSQNSEFMTFGIQSISQRIDLDRRRMEIAERADRRAELQQDDLAKQMTAMQSDIADLKTLMENFLRRT